MCSNGVATDTPKSGRTKCAGSGEPLPSGGLRVRAYPATVTNIGARHWMTTDRAFDGASLGNGPVTEVGTTPSAPIWGKGTEYAGRLASPSSGASQSPGRVLSEGGKGEAMEDNVTDEQLEALQNRLQRRLQIRYGAQTKSGEVEQLVHADTIREAIQAIATLRKLTPPGRRAA